MFLFFRGKLEYIKNYYNTFKMTAYQIVSILLMSGVSSLAEVSVLLFKERDNFMYIDKYLLFSLTA